MLTFKQELQLFLDEEFETIEVGQSLDLIS